MLLSGKKTIVWVQKDSVSIFLLGKKPKKSSFDLKLFTSKTSKSLLPLSSFLKENKVKQVSVLVNEPLSGQQSFVYDAPEDQISRQELIGIASHSFSFEIDNPYLAYDFHKKADKTVIRVTGIDQKKLEPVLKNLQDLGIKVLGFDLVSSSLAKIFSRFHPKPFILLHSLDKKKTLVLIIHNSKVYHSELKNTTSLKIQSIVNKVKMFFDTGPLDKIFFQSGCLPDLTKDSKLHIVNFNSEDITRKLKLTKDLPLPVLGTTLKQKKQLIKIKPKTMTLDEKPKKEKEEVVKLTDTEKKPQIKEEIEPKPEKELEVKEDSKVEEIKEKPQEQEKDDSEEAFKILAASQVEKSPKGKILILAVVSALVTVAILTIFVLKPFSKDTTDSTEEPLVQEVPTQAPSPTATPAPEVFYEASVKVQNGTSIAGLAGTLKSEITDLDFEEVTATNAPEKTTKNTISCKESYLDTANSLKESLENIFPASISADLEEDDDYDIIITIGKDLEEEETVEEEVEEEETDDEEESTQE